MALNISKVPRENSKCAYAICGKKETLLKYSKKI